MDKIIRKSVLQGIARSLGYDPNNVIEIHATARDVEVIVVDLETGDESSHYYRVGPEEWLTARQVSQAVEGAARGESVAVFAESLPEAQLLAKEMMSAVPIELAERVSHRNGDHYVDLVGGGRIRFMSTRQSVRGMRLDRAYIPVGANTQFLQDIVPALCTSAVGELVRY